MKTRRQTVSENPLTITRRNTRPDNERKLIADPVDLIIEILARLPAKSIARCRCLSKLCDSTLRLPYFTELFLTTSSARPQLLFACQKHGKLFFFSSPQPRNPDENSSPIVADYHMKLSVDGPVYEMNGIVHGLVCLIYNTRIPKGKTEKVQVICNPSTGQSLPLPKVRTKRVTVVSYLGYDPVDKKYKVLSMTWLTLGNQVVCGEHQILTLGTPKLSWRMIECCIPHDLPHKHICIDGVLYYPATNRSSVVNMIVCFDVRSETFKSITVVGAVYRAVRDGHMINYNGKLGLLVCEGSWFVDGSLELWVLEEIEKQVWSEHAYVFPPLWKDIVGTSCSRFVGVTRTNEIVFFFERMMHSCVIYCNLERKTIVRVGIDGFESLKNRMVHIFLDHVENVNLGLAF
ncbi:putative F-box protein At2g19630 [Capsella rubella]|uniref:putative F-box protein At2g19630 n=1 Tax=Capsella rubella TaxID=81985 RepID=UPI000CD50962|nr:putative F-box protein At2g19630 [Capsella rubella]